jgi:hypothetical protein
VSADFQALHHRVRAELWGFVPDEPFDLEMMIAEEFVGIRPAPGYPAQPDHTDKATLFSLPDATAATGIELTESFAMSPAAAVSGLYFANPAARYFDVGKIERDQAEDYARRKGWTLQQAERWLPRSSTTNRRGGRRRRPTHRSIGSASKRSHHTSATSSDSASAVSNACSKSRAQ